ncbi:hypothetical protein [Flavobacterium sp. LC2016-12]|uniref:hypothetical protein n=1 Tax=Flavobacterium sp. LC2016-12 TaxID=2783794 RepID=UPI00188B01FD|nr:hypothetical protein [Flavobacterium sp. LC2016-12]MBF4464000.1 hypothetical protein [Flavobacterium sp. LC2016-12]
MKRKILVSIVLIVSTLLVVIVSGLYSMEIEDHYGDLQQIYFDSKSGDIIVNRQTQKFGVITKNWKRADVITKENDNLDLYELVYINQIENKYEVFRSEKELKIKELTFDKIVELKEKKLLETVIKN